MDQESTDRPDVEDDLTTTAKARFQDAVRHQAQWRAQAEEDFGFVAGDQWDQSDLDWLRDQLRPAVTYNRILPMIDAVAGHEVSNRQEVRYIPRELGDVGVNELLTGAAEWARDQCDAEDEESDAFFDTLVCGMGWTQTRMDWETDPEGAVVIERVDPFEMYWDPTARKRNLDDAEYVFRVKRYAPAKAKALFPDLDQGMADMGGWDALPDNLGDPHHTRPGDQYQSDDEKAPYGRSKGDVTIYEYQWAESERVVALPNPQTGQPELVDEGTAKRLLLNAALRGLIDPASAVGIFEQGQRTRRRVYRAFFAGSQVLQQGLAPDPENFTYQCITGKRDRNNNYWFGLVRSLKDPQRWANKYFSQMMHILNTNSLGGVLYEPDAFVDPAQAEADWSKPNAMIPMEEGAIRDGRYAEKPRAEVPVSLVNMMQFSLAAMREVSGVNIELLGMADRDQAGVVEHQRKQSGLTILATLFDSLRRYRKNQGRVLLCFIRKYISDNRLVRIVGSDGKQQYVPLAKQPDTATYDVIVDEAPSSPNQKERTFAMITAMFPPQTWPMLPPAMTLEILRYSPLPESLVNRLAELYEQQGQDPAQAAIQQLAMRQAQADVEKTQSETVENQADAYLKRVKAMAEGVTVPARVLQMAREPRAAR